MIARIVLSAACALLPCRALAQTSLQIPLQFDFINPGAKSLALGGAFVGVADDATAPFANPAGLLMLETSKIAGELRGLRTSTEFLQGGRLSGDIINQGTDTIQGPDFAKSIGSNLGVGYAAGIHVHSPRTTSRIWWSLAGYRHELARVDQRFLSNGVFQKDPTEFTSRRDSPQAGVREVSITGYGVAASYRPHTNLMMGAAVAVYRFSIDSTFRRFDINGFLGPPNLEVEFGRSTQLGSDTAVAPTFGVLVDRPLGGRPWRLGAVYRHGASFTFKIDDAVAPGDSHFRVPHSLAVGLSMRLRPQLLLAGEVTRVTYSRLMDDFIVKLVQAIGREANFTIDDGTEVHIGLEYERRRSKKRPVLLRVGGWFDPDHSVHFRSTGPGSTATDRLFDERLSTALSKGRNQAHVTGGLGWILSSRFELNAGADVSKTTRLFSTSISVNVGREVGP